MPQEGNGAALDVIEWLRKLAVDTHEGKELTLDEETLADAALELEGLRHIVRQLQSQLDGLRKQRANEELER